MLQIRLRRDPSTDSGGISRPSPAETVTVACPDHLVLADLPVAKGIGSVTSASVSKTVGRRSRRQLGERVHFCVRCDFPIAVYGRLSPCEHAFCLECARSDSICYLCDERIQKIQTIKMMEGIFICAAPHCLKSFMKKSDFDLHIYQTHSDLLQPNVEKEDGKESEVQSAKQSSASDSNFRPPATPAFSPSSISQHHDHDDKARRQQQLPPRPVMQPKMPPPFAQTASYPTDPQGDSNLPPGFDRPASNNRFQQSFEGTPQREPNQGVLSETQYPEYPLMHPLQRPTNFVFPMNQNPILPPPFPYPSDGTQPVFNTPYPGSAQEGGSDQGSLLGFPPGGGNFSGSYPPSWNSGPPNLSNEGPTAMQGVQEGFTNRSESQGKNTFYQADYGRNPSMNGMDAGQGSNNVDGNGILTSQPLQAPLIPPPLPHLSQQNQRGQFYSGDGFGGNQE